MSEPTSSEQVEARIAELGDWRGEHAWKWRGVPTFEHQRGEEEFLGIGSA